MSNWTERDFENFRENDWKLIREIKMLADENSQNQKILAHAHELAVLAMEFCSLNQNNTTDGITMNLNEYTQELLAAAKNPEHDLAWAREFGEPIDEFIAYGAEKFADKKS